MFARFARRCVLAVVIVLPPTVTFGQPTPVTPLDPAPPAEPPVSATAVLTGTADAAPIGDCGDDRADLTIGLPLAARYQHRIGRSRYWAEVGAGLYLIIPDVFAGARADWGLYEGRRNTVSVRPGIAAHVAVWPFGNVLGNGNSDVTVLPGVATDVDFVWRRVMKDQLHGEFGVKLGVITMIGREEVVPLPTVGFLCGFQF